MYNRRRKGLFRVKNKRNIPSSKQRINALETILSPARFPFDCTVGAFHRLASLVACLSIQTGVSHERCLSFGPRLEIEHRRRRFLIFQLSTGDPAKFISALRLPERIRQFFYDSGQGLAVSVQEVTLVSIRHSARRGPSGVRRQALSP
jgi:hypothetical protein